MHFTEVHWKLFFLKRKEIKYRRIKNYHYICRGTFKVFII